MMNPTGCRIRRGCLSAALALAATWMALPALAAGSRLDEANTHLIKAAALLNAAASPTDTRAASSHRELAIRLIKQAEGEIARAKQAADAPRPGRLRTMPRAR